MPKHNSDIAPAVAARRKKTAAAKRHPILAHNAHAHTDHPPNAAACPDCELRQTLLAAFPQFFTRNGVFLRAKFDAALRDPGRHAGAPVLTKHQRKILELLDAGRRHKEIAYELKTSHASVRVTVCMMRKLLGPARVPLLIRCQSKT